MVYGAVKPRQIVGPDPDIQDYELSKYTNTSDDRKQHNDARETYVTVGGMVESAAHKAKIANGQLKDFATFMQLASATEQKIDFDRLRTDYEREVRFFGREPLMDIVTIRNRWWTFQITLSEVVAELAKANFNYTDIHCSFCRSEYKGGKLSQSAQPAD